MRIYAEAWPSGGWAVRLVGHSTPISRHDTEQEALHKAAAYRRGHAGLRRAQFETTSGLGRARA